MLRIATIDGGATASFGTSLLTTALASIATLLPLLICPGILAPDHRYTSPAVTGTPSISPRLVFGDGYEKKISFLFSFALVTAF
jgi:hypothetical protein